MLHSLPYWHVRVALLHQHSSLPSPVLILPSQLETRCSILLSPSSSYYAPYSRPPKYKPTQRLTQNPSSEPNLPPRATALLHTARTREVRVRFPARQYHLHERADSKAAEDVEEETVVGFEAEDAGGDSQNEAGEGADIGEDLMGGFGR